MLFINMLYNHLFLSPVIVMFGSTYGFDFGGREFSPPLIYYLRGPTREPKSNAAFNSLIACLHDQNKSDFLEGRLFPTNQGFLKTFQIILIGWIKAGLPQSKKATFVLIM